MRKGELCLNIKMKTILIHNKVEWLHHPLIKWTEEEIKSADQLGYIGTVYEIDCYVVRPLEDVKFTHK